MLWKDTTGYSRDKERIPTTWSVDIGDLHVTVTCGHIYHKGIWILQCEPWFRQRELKQATSAETAQAIALMLLREKVGQLHAALN